MARSKKRAAPTAASQRPAKKRKSAEASLLKMKEINEAEDAFSEDEKKEANPLVAGTNAPEEDAESDVDTDGLQDHEMITSEALPLVAPGFRVWKTSSKLASKGEFTQISKYDEEKEAFTHVVKVNNDEEFTLMPLIVTSGPYKGRRIFMLEPTNGFPFFYFPPEIRNHIYSFMVESGDCRLKISTSKRVNEPRRPVIGGECYDSKTKKWVHPGTLFSTLLRTNKQIFREAAPILYGTNHFRFNGFGNLKIFLDRIGSMRKYIHHISMDSPGFQRSKVRTTLNMLKDATDIRTLTFDHKNLCDDSVPHYYHRTTIRGFTYFLNPFIRALLRTQSQSSRQTSVLDIIKIDWERCVKCEDTAPNFPVDSDCRQAYNPTHWNRGCKVICEDLAAHCKEVEQKCREQFAKDLHITLSSADSDREAPQEL